MKPENNFKVSLIILPMLAQVKNNTFQHYQKITKITNIKLI